MKQYRKPMVLVNGETAEGVYTASGVNSSDGGVKCDSIYMKGVWQNRSHDSAVFDSGAGMKECYGCEGCRAHNYGGVEGCGLDTHYVDSGYASSYDSDNGLRKPTWEQRGYGPDEPANLHYGEW